MNEHDILLKAQANDKPFTLLSAEELSKKYHDWLSEIPLPAEVKDGLGRDTLHNRVREEIQHNSSYAHNWG